MKNYGFYIMGILAILFFCQTASIEARGHSHHRGGARVQVNLGVNGGYRDAYTVRRYVTPAAPVAYAPVAYAPVASPYAAPMYAPVYAPVYAPSYPTYVEEVQRQPVCRPILSLAGLSFSWNFR